MSHHLLVTGPQHARRALLAAETDLCASCHTNLGGPYAGVASVLRALVPLVHDRAPELTARHRLELVCAVPDLADVVGDAPAMLVEITPQDERTRFFGRSLIRAMSHGIVTFVVAAARDGNQPLTLALDALDAAEPTTQEFAVILLRRADPTLVRVLIGVGEQPLPSELADACARYTRTSIAPPIERTDERDAGERLRAYIGSDGTSEDSNEIAAYAAADPEERVRLHDARADALEACADWGLRLGPIPYHRERGSDPGGAGRRALRAALERCVEVGYSAATVDFGMRGRAVCDPVEHQQDYCHFSGKAASALVPLGRIAECHAIYHELRRRYSIPRVQMTCSYALAVLYTRFSVPRDHDTALEWINNARAIAELEPDPIDAPYFQVFQDNGLALVAMHRGDLARSLELVDAGIERLERELPSDRYVVHRSQLLHNRARVLAALGRLDEADADFGRLTEWDPNYVEYHTDRGNLHRRRGDLDAALACYERAVAVSPPLPDMFYNRATIRTQAGLTAGALEDLDYALEMEPGMLNARMARAALRLAQDDTPGALEDAQLALADHVDDAAVHALLAECHEALGDNHAARAAFANALELDPDFVPALVNSAVLEHGLGDLDRAIHRLTRALEIKGDDPDILFNRGFVLRESGDGAAAARDFQAALRLPGCDRELVLVQLAGAETADVD